MPVQTPEVIMQYRIIDSPIDPLVLAGVGSTLMFLLMQDHHHVPVMDSWVYNEHAYADVVDQLAEYFCGHRQHFDITMHLEGTVFQQRVWKALQDIPYGHTRSYGYIAHQIGCPHGSRAVGLANGRNPISIIIPCHRVIGSTGRLTGYGGGLERKKFLLDLEQQYRTGS